jgi:hypothetical protein
MSLPVDVRASLKELAEDMGMSAGFLEGKRVIHHKERKEHKEG